MTRKYEGLASVGITTGAYLLNPKDALAIANILNQDGFDVDVQLYAFKKTLLLPPTGLQTKIYQKGLPLPTGISVQNIIEWNDKYPQTNISSVHFPFAHNFRQALGGVTHASKDSPMSNLHHFAHLLYFGWATDNHALSLAQAARPVSRINIHQDVFKRYIDTGTVAQLTQAGPNLLIEDSTNPPKTIAELVRPFNLGFTLGLDHLDHLDTAFLTVEDVLADPGVQQYTEAIHLSLPDHQPLNPRDPLSDKLLSLIANTPFDHPVTGYLDYGPYTLKGLSASEQLIFWRNQVEWIRSTQPQTREKLKAFQH